MRSVVALIAVFVVVGGVSAQQPGFSRTVIQRGDLSTPGKEVVSALAEFQPGATAGSHTHPGEEAGYVLEGTLIFEIAGKPPVTLKAGDVLFIPAGAIHSAKNVGSGHGAELATYVVEKGKPLITIVK